MSKVHILGCKSWTSKGDGPLADRPRPIATSDITPPEEILQRTGRLAEDAPDRWVRRR